MRLLSGPERAFLSAVSELAYCNPFLPERLKHERAALGPDFLEGEPVWSLQVDEPERPRANVWRIVAKLEPLATHLRERLRTATSAPPERDLRLYEDAIVHLLYQRYYQRFVEAAALPPGPTRWRFYQDFVADWRHLLQVPGVEFPTHYDPPHMFACFRLVHCAFDQIFRDIIGGSMAAARLRAAVWQSIFTHDMRRFIRTFYQRMGDFATLITGPSGTGKELAARAVAQSRYIPFDERKLAFTGDDAALFSPINISALPPTLVESELFGHRRGSFTGAIADRRGWLETCPPQGSVFLDELGDLDPAIQVKLLRVIETRSFHPVGATTTISFRGKLIAATHRDLAQEIQRGRFREDLYYRLCSDQIMTPSLAEQVSGAPHILRELIVYMARKVAGPESDALAAEVIEWIEAHLEPDYAWPGNYRELEQCVRNVLIRGDYRPSRPKPEPRQVPPAAQVASGNVTADELISRYCTAVYAETGSYEETARRLKLDRRTVKSKINGA